MLQVSHKVPQRAVRGSPNLHASIKKRKKMKIGKQRTEKKLQLFRVDIRRLPHLMGHKSCLVSCMANILVATISCHAQKKNPRRARQKIKTSRTHFMRMWTRLPQKVRRSRSRRRDWERERETQACCTRAQRDNNEKQFTKSTQRLDQKQRRCRKGAGTEAGDAAPKGAGRGGGGGAGAATAIQRKTHH